MKDMQAALCIVHCNKVSKPVKGKYLLLCMNIINLIYFNHVFKSFKSLNIENYKFHEIFQKRVLKYYIHEILKYFKVEYLIVHL